MRKLCRGVLVALSMVVMPVAVGNPAPPEAPDASTAEVASPACEAPIPEAVFGLRASTDPEVEETGGYYGYCHIDCTPCVQPEFGPSDCPDFFGWPQRCYPQCP